MDIYAECIKLGVKTDHHESDLYVPVNDTTKALIEDYQWKRNVTTFIDNIDHIPYYCIPFAYTPFWKRAKVI